MTLLPRVEHFKQALLGLIVFAAVAVPFSLLTELFEFRLASTVTHILNVAVVSFFLPALFEEILFRGPVAWMSYVGSRKLLYVVAISFLLFILWHPLNGIFLMTQARDLFTDWRFLLMAGWLGLVATHLAIKTRSIWPPVIFHWLVVVGWKVFLGGPNF